MISCRSEYRDTFNDNINDNIKNFIDMIEVDVNDVIDELEKINDGLSVEDILDWVDSALTNLKRLAEKLYWKGENKEWKRF